MKWKLGLLIGSMFLLSIALFDPNFGQRSLLILHSSEFPSLIFVYSMVILRLIYICVCVDACLYIYVTKLETCSSIVVYMYDAIVDRYTFKLSINSFSEQ